MPSFHCPVCDRDVSYSRLDEERFAKRGWECDECYIVIGKHRYNVNQFGATTVFSPMGAGLGDSIVKSVILDQYNKDNPDEKIIPLSMIDVKTVLSQFKPAKFFLADTCPVNRDDVPDDDRVIWFSLCGEADYYASQGIYPQLHYQPVKPAGFDLQRFVVLHIRYIGKVPSKNSQPFIINRIIEYLFDLYRSGQIDGVVIPGNDQPAPEIYIPKEFCIDYRQKLMLPEIAWLLQNSIITVGKDSGIIHMAAAVGSRIVAWDYVSYKWFPKCPRENFTAYMQDAADYQMIVDAVKEKGRFV